MTVRKAVVLFGLVMLLTVFSLKVAAQEDETFSLTIMHTNDVHSYNLASFSGNGGAAIQAAVVNQIRGQATNSLLLDAGDRFTGTLFYTQYHGQDQAQLMNALGYDAMSLGNHEFDGGDQTLADFINIVDFPVLAANIDVTGSESLNGLVAPYAILDVNGQQVGIIGMVTADAENISSPSDAITFNSDYAAVANAIAADLTAQGISKIILVAHTGIFADAEYIPNLENIDIVIGGHSHTLLSNTNTGSIGGSAAAGPYPMAFETASGATVYYGTAGQYDAYLGRMDVVFDAEGVVTSASGDTILLSQYITPDSVVADMVAELDAPLEEVRNTLIGATTEVALVGDRRVCRVEECNLGNLIADAMRAQTGAQIAIMNGGGIRSDIDAGEITLGEVLNVQPFGNTIATFSATGADIVAALENGVSGIVATDGVVQRDGAPGRFPQVSGLHYTIDPTQEVGSRIVGVDVEQPDGTYAPIDLEAVYTVVTINFVRTGGDGYTVFAENAINPYDFGPVDYEPTRAYLIANTPVAPAVEGRITYVEGVTVAPLE